MYVDLLKGFTVIWVLWMHLGLPELVNPSVQMPVFFFISGAFYHAKSPNLWGQVRVDARRLLVPMACFTLLTFVIRAASGSLGGGYICRRQ